MKLLFQCSILMPRLVLTIFIVCLCVGCGNEQMAQPMTPSQIKALESTSVNPIKLQGEVSETFALGGNHTDLQRDIMRKKLIGSTAEWQLPVYEVLLSDGVYKVQTKGVFGLRIRAPI